MNYHSDDWIMAQVIRHYKEALSIFSEEQIIGIFYSGSANYGLDTINSDVDTKLIIIPTFKSMALNNTPISTTHNLENNEQIVIKDVRSFIPALKKQDINILETLFTPYCYINPFYNNDWNKLIETREDIARYDTEKAVKSLKGQAISRYASIEHKTIQKEKAFNTYNYSPKDLAFLLKLETYLINYLNEKPYYECIHFDNSEYLKAVKSGMYSLDEARLVATQSLNHIKFLSDEYLDSKKGLVNKNIENLLNEIQYNIVKKAIKKEINNEI